MVNSSVGRLVCWGDSAPPPRREWGASLSAFDNARGRRTAPLQWDTLRHWLADGPEGPGAAEVGCWSVGTFVGLLVIGSTRANTVTGGRHRAGG